MELLLIVRFIHGIGFGASVNAIMTIASAILPKKRFGEAFGYLMIGTTLSVGIGPYIGGLLFDYNGFWACFTAASIFSFIALMSIYFLDFSHYDQVNNDNHNSENNDGFKKVFEYSAVPVSLFSAFTSIGYVAILSFYRLYAVEVNLTNYFSWFFLIYLAVLIVSRPLAGKIQDNYGDRLICSIGIIFQSAGLLLIALSPSAITIIICAISLALGFGTLNSAGITIVTRNTPENR